MRKLTQTYENVVGMLTTVYLLEIVFSITRGGFYWRNDDNTTNIYLILTSAQYLPFEVQRRKMICAKITRPKFESKAARNNH